jgi:peptidoglycan/LPS O-acetylase OafA/YrhL
MTATDPTDENETVTVAMATGPPAAAARAAPVGISGGYQPALDGVRAIAVGLVMIFHLGLDWKGLPLGGGWLGVDVFFVLSGYLITSLLLAERRKSGRTNLRNFYVRRLLRLAPLSVLLVVVCWVGQRIGLSSPLGLALSSKGALSILFYVANWMHLRSPGSVGAMMHTWSLSIEEQFYLIWPAVLIGAFALAKRGGRWALIALTAAAAIGCGLYRRHLWNQVWAQGPSGDPWRTWRHFFFSSFERPDGLVVGCLLALLLHGFTPTRAVRVVVDFLGIIGTVVASLIIVQAPFRTWTPWVRFMPAWGLSALNLSVAAVLASLVLHPTSLGAKVLSLRPLCWIGRRAYGIYLIHPLVIVIVVRQTDLPASSSILLVVAASLLVAGASFHWIETPFLRLKDRFSSHVTPAPAPEPAT